MKNILLFIFLIIVFSCTNGYKNTESMPIYDSSMIFSEDSTSITMDTPASDEENFLYFNRDTFLIESISIEIKDKKALEKDTVIKKDTLEKKKISKDPTKLDTSSVLMDLKKNRLVISNQQKILDSLIINKRK